MVIGGGDVYALFLPRATRIYLTRVHKQVEGDAYFPPLDDAQWAVVEEEDSADPDGPPVTYLILERREVAQHAT